MADRILVTGAAGFIGWKTVEKLLERDYEVVGIDNLNTYYDVRLKKYRLNLLNKHKNFIFYKRDIENIEELDDIFRKYRFSAIINLAARAGVRSSIEKPELYLRTNALGTLNILQMMKKYDIKKLILASTSSLYASQNMPFKEDLPVNTPISPYAASKKAAEMLCYVYHYLYGFNVTILRYFTVYGPAGRPDMSIFRFIYLIRRGLPIEVYGDGTQKRDFTFVDDIAKGTVEALKLKSYHVINLGNNSPVELNYVIRLIEKYLNRKAEIRYREFHKADIKATWADIEKATQLLNWKPQIGIEEGIEKTVQWFEENKSLIDNISIG